MRLPSECYGYDNWISEQLNPDELKPLKASLSKNITPEKKRGIFLQWELEDMERARLGEDEFQKKVEEWREYEAQRFEDRHD